MNTLKVSITENEMEKIKGQVLSDCTTKELIEELKKRKHFLKETMNTEINSSINEVTFANSLFNNTDFLKGSVLKNSVFKNCTFHNTDFTGALLKNVTFIDNTMHNTFKTKDQKITEL